MIFNVKQISKFVSRTESADDSVESCLGPI